jgi:hypothetical protein
MFYFVVSWFYAFVKSHSLIPYLRVEVFASLRGSLANPDFSLSGAIFEWTISVGRMRGFSFLQ